MALPLLIGGVCIITSIIGTYFVRIGKSGSIMGALYKGFWLTAGLSVPALLRRPGSRSAATSNAARRRRFGRRRPRHRRTRRCADGFNGWDLFWCMLVGLGVTGLIVWITEYYTGTNYRPVKSIAKASETGHGTNVIQGLAISLESTALPTLVICVGIIVSYQFAGLIGIAFARPRCLRSPEWSSRSTPTGR
jgi:K(+)-stimulated pyrophosphate-energized sodium pump